MKRFYLAETKKVEVDQKRSGSILIVDDNEEILELLEETVKAHTDFEVITTQKPESVSDLLNDHKIDIMLLDMVMPGMNGIEVFNHIRSRSIYIPVIFLTGKGDGELKKEALTLGAFDFLSKPVRAKDLLLIVAEAHKTVQKIRKILSRSAS